jgi:FkbM family methyltransferase
VRTIEKLRHFLRGLLNRAGFDLVRTSNQHASYQDHLLNVLDRYKIDCIIDVGANTGQFGTGLRQLGFAGWIVSFEPVQAVFRELQEHAALDSRWLCHPLALGDCAQTKSINVYSSSMFSSFLDANDYAQGIWKSLREASKEQVEVRRLDEMFSELKQATGARNFMLKLDTQGFDRNAFAGAAGCVDEIRVLQSELSLIAVYSGMQNVYDTLNDFHRQGFFISGMYPINRDESLAVIEYDCILVRPEGKVATA